MFPEFTLTYPEEWEEEYKKHGYVKQWISEYPSLFNIYLDWFTKPGILSTILNTLDVFAQYALMYLLKKAYGIDSIAWFCLGCRNKKHKNWTKIQQFWNLMKKIMGEDIFDRLFFEVNQKISSHVSDPYAGEPDLFCWAPGGTVWFFAEAKRGNEPLPKHQPLWFKICEEVTGQAVRIYRLTPTM